MLDPLFSFVDPFMEPVVELSEDNSCFVIPVETLLDFMEKAGIDKTANMPEGARIEVPIDIVISMLKPHELEKQQQYIASYLAKHGSSEV